MKKWTISLEAKDEEQAAVLLKLAFEAFTVATKFNEPLHIIEATLRGQPPVGRINCQEVKTDNK